MIGIDTNVLIRYLTSERWRSPRSSSGCSASELLDYRSLGCEYDSLPRSSGGPADHEPAGDGAAAEGTA